ncbi:MAG: hypothetical protein H7Y10_07250 [Flavobacterium sp.]|nr:hypothetical protein [Flavobacterium sp.]
MKNISIHITIIFVFSYYTFAQKVEIPQIGKNIKTTQKEFDTLIESKSNLIKSIKSYYVEENSNQKFEGYTMTYDATHITFIDKYDIAPNNSIVITSRYGEVKQLSNSQIETNKNLVKPITMFD